METTPQEYVSIEKVHLLEKENNELKIKMSVLEHELANLKRMIFGSKSEKFISKDQSQLSLDLGLDPVIPEPTKVETITVTKTKPQKQLTKAIRQAIPSHLPRKEVIIEPECIPEGAIKIGEIITEVLEYKPGRLFVTRYIRPKYIIPQDEKIINAELPSLLIPKGNASASLLAYIIVSKFVDHLPFYRLVQMFKRDQITLSQSTINGWFSSVCNLLEPLYNALVKKTLECDYLMADETPIPVQTTEKKGTTHTGYHWIYYSPTEHLVCFDYRKSRTKDGPLDFLENFKGALQTDGYAAYNGFEKNQDIILLACMAHARRKFEHALDNDKELAQYALLEFQKLYEIERLARENNLSDEQIKDLRQEKSLPILNSFEQWMKQKLLQTLPKSAIGQAIAYTLNLWNRLKRYILDGRYQIDNNLIENSIRPSAIGRKNYLFAGSHQGAKRVAMMYSFMGTCKINNINPLEWLTHVLEVIPDWKANKINELLPSNFKK